MNPALTLESWGMLFGWLALEAAALVGVAALTARFFRNLDLRLALWQVAMLGLGALVVCEITGLGLTQSRDEKPASMAPLLPVRVEMEAEGFASEIPMGDPIATSEARYARPPEGSGPSRAMAQWWPAGLWVFGALLLILRQCAAHLRLAWGARRFRILEDDALKQRAESLRPRLGLTRPLRLVTGSRLRGPVAFGLLRPTIVVPVDFTERFSEPQQAAMLAHEMAHLAGRDPLWQMLANVAVALWWWHPAAWWGRRQLRLHSELSADGASGLVENGRTALAESLLILGRELALSSTVRGLGVEGAGFRSDLARRVTRLLSVAESGRPALAARGGWRWISRCMGSALVVGVALGPWPWTKARALRPSVTEFVRATWGLRFAADTIDSSRSRATLALGDAHPNPLPNEVQPPGAPPRPTGELGSLSSTVPTSTGRLRIAQALDHWVLPGFVVSNRTELTTVVMSLSEQVQRLDPKGAGVNFIVDDSAPVSSGVAVDPSTGIQVSQEPEPIHVLPIPVIRDVRLRDVLNAIVASTEPPIQCAVEDYAVVMRRVDPDLTPALYTRRFKTDPSIFLRALDSVLVVW